MGSHQDMDLSLIQKLIEYEETLSQLYAACAQRFPQHQDLWWRLSSDERSHGEILRVLYGKCQRKQLVLNQRRFSPQAVGTALAYVRDLITQLGEGKISYARALSLARDIESSVIEKKFYEVFSGESEELTKVFRTLEIDTQEHRDRLAALAADGR
jgi:rubrerythrin